METPLIILFILILSFLIALRSMRELKSDSETFEKILEKGIVRGSIIFFKDKVIHYSTANRKNQTSSSSSSATEESGPK